MVSIDPLSGRQKKEPGFVARPKSITCHICGREFGTSSIGIHAKQCAKKFEKAEMERHPNNPEKRRPVPKESKVLGALAVAKASGKAISGAMMDKLNEESYQQWSDEALEMCLKCGRTFRTEALVIHKRLRGCKPKKGYVPPVGFCEEVGGSS
jgi:hypothetical protein